MPDLSGWTPYKKFRFRFGFGGPDHSWKEIGVYRLATTPDGFVVWRAHAVNRPVLATLLEGVRRVRVTLRDSAREHGRTLLFAVQDPVPLLLDCHAVEDDIALEGILFRRYKLVSMDDQTFGAELVDKK